MMLLVGRSSRRSGRFVPGKVRGGVALLGLAAVVSACGSSGSGPGSNASADAPKSPFLIGFIGPLSGSAASLGTPQLKGVQAAVDAVNRKGGVNGHPVKVIPEDDQADPAKSIAAVRDLAAQGVYAVYGPVLSQDNEAAAPTIAQVKMTMVGLSATTKLLVPAQRYQFQSGMNATAETRPMADVAKALVGKSDFKAALAPLNSALSKEWVADEQKLAQSEGFTILHSTLIPFASADLTAQAQEIASGNPDVVLAQVVDPNLQPLIRKLRQLGFSGPIVNYHGGGTPQMLGQLKDENVYIGHDAATMGEAPDGKQGIKDFEDAIAADNVGADAGNPNFGDAYLAALEDMAAFAKCGDNCNADTYSEAINHLDFDTKGLAFANIRYTPDRHQGGADVFYHWDGSKITRGLGGKVFPGSVYDNS